MAKQKQTFTPDVERIKAVLKFRWQFSLDRFRKHDAGKRVLACPTSLHCCDRTTKIYWVFTISKTALKSGFILLSSQVFLILNTYYYNSSSSCSNMFVLVKNTSGIEMVINDACSFDLLWRRKYICRKSTRPKFSEIQEKHPCQ